MPLRSKHPALISSGKATIIAALVHAVIFSAPALGSLAYHAGIESRLNEIATIMCVAFGPGVPASTIVLARGLRRHGLAPERMLPSCLLAGVAIVISSALLHLAFWPLAGEDYYSLPGLSIILAACSALILPVVLLIVFVFHRFWMRCFNRSAAPR